MDEELGVDHAGLSIVAPRVCLYRIVARYTASYSTTYTYVGNSDWLLKETKYPSGGAAFDLIQYRYISPKLMRTALRDGGACNMVIYLQLNWHGDFYRGYGTDGGIVNTQQGDEWGNWPSSQSVSCGAPHAYHWNGQWGYQFFADLSAPNGTDPQLGLYYVHGRWYNPEVGLFISPDEKGEYFYGSGQDPANWDWIVNGAIALGQSGPLGRAIVLGGGGFIRDTAIANYQIFFPPAEWTIWDRLGNTTRGVAPIFAAEGVVFLAPKVASAGVAYLGRSLLGRVTTSATAACAADQRDCANAISAVTSWAPQGGRIMLGRFTEITRLRELAQQNAATILDQPYPIDEAAGRDLGYFLRAEIDAAQQIYFRMKDVVPGTISYDIELRYILSRIDLLTKTRFIPE